MKDTKEKQYHPLMDGKDWTSRISTPECIKLIHVYRDVCEREIEFLDSQGYIDTRKAFPKKFLNKYLLYQHLREHKLCPKCSHAESVLKKSKTKE